MNESSYLWYSWNFSSVYYFQKAVFCGTFLLFKRVEGMIFAVIKVSCNVSLKNSAAAKYSNSPVKLMGISLVQFSLKLVEGGQEIL